MFIRFVIKIRGCSEEKCHHPLKTSNFENQVFLFLGGFFPSPSALFISYFLKKGGVEKDIR